MQVQAQLFCTQMKYCDFVVCTEEAIHVECIELDLDFITPNIEKASSYFQTAILPELYGHWYSRVPPSSSVTSIIQAAPAQLSTPLVPTHLESADKTYCYCQQKDDGELQMIGCDNEQCPYEWFHLSCLKLKHLPKAKIWYCPDCHKLKKAAAKR